MTRSLLLTCALALVVCPTRVLAGPPLVPPQLTAACAKLAAGAACTVHFQSKTLSGVCQQLPDHSHACLPAKHGKSAPRPQAAPRPDAAPRPEAPVQPEAAPRPQAPSKPDAAPRPQAVPKPQAAPKPRPQ